MRREKGEWEEAARSRRVRGECKERWRQGVRKTNAKRRGVSSEEKGSEGQSENEVEEMAGAR
jgi:hypothetical protein